ncbi:hypothetical protein [Sphaerimonospora thailandensis]|uniref:Alkaline shock response membrane anchor protein AmaP n=1 Tax=Sphaerimonospora thailandensis TaxID=795644 RepID=A0A8J3R7M3_9ACTN|nr:hypothetical protein [Sphaerimonospora thailandensis]GIH70597.1 hypothetical protein Mth01_28500 [Sphaerimonospora thailandensis]
MRSHLRAHLRSHLGNRVGIGLVGLALVGGGGYVMSVRLDRPHDPVMDLASLTAGRPWAWPLAAGVALLLALAATRWLLSALGWRRCGSRTASGIAMLGVALRGVDGIAGIKVRIVGERRMRVSLSLRPEADLPEVVARLDRSAISRARGAVGLPDLPAVARLHVRRR